MKTSPKDRVYDANENGTMLLVFYIKRRRKTEEKKRRKAVVKCKIVKLQIIIDS